MKIVREIIHLVVATLFTVVLWVLNGSFGSEFLILKKGLWMFIVFSVLLLGNAIFFLIYKIITEKKGITKPFEKITPVVIISIVWNFIVALLLLAALIYLFILITCIRYHYE